jgi:hypothetical protein
MIADEDRVIDVHTVTVVDDDTLNDEDDETEDVEKEDKNAVADASMDPDVAGVTELDNEPILDTVVEIDATNDIVSRAERDTEGCIEVDKILENDADTDADIVEDLDDDNDTAGDADTKLDDEGWADVDDDTEKVAHTDIDITSEADWGDNVGESESCGECDKSVDIDHCGDTDGLCEIVSEDESDVITVNEARGEADCSNDIVVSPVCEGKYSETVACEVRDGSYGDSVAETIADNDTLGPEDIEGLVLNELVIDVLELVEDEGTAVRLTANVVALATGVLQVTAVFDASGETELLANGEVEKDGDRDEVILEAKVRETLAVDETLEVIERCGDKLLLPDTEGEEVDEVDISAVLDLFAERVATWLPLKIEDILEIYDGEGVFVSETVSLEKNDCVGIDVTVTTSLFTGDWVKNGVIDVDTLTPSEVEGCSDADVDALPAVENVVVVEIDTNALCVIEYEIVNLLESLWDGDNDESELNVTPEYEALEVEDKDTDELTLPDTLIVALLFADDDGE